MYLFTQSRARVGVYFIFFKSTSVRETNWALSLVFLHSFAPNVFLPAQLQVSLAERKMLQVQEGKVEEAATLGF